MDSWLKKSNDNGNKPTANDVEAAVKANCDIDLQREKAEVQ